MLFNLNRNQTIILNTDELVKLPDIKWPLPATCMSVNGAVLTTARVHDHNLTSLGGIHLHDGDLLADTYNLNIALEIMGIPTQYIPGPGSNERIEITDGELSLTLRGSGSMLLVRTVNAGWQELYINAEYGVVGIGATSHNYRRLENLPVETIINIYNDIVEGEDVFSKGYFKSM